MSSRRCSLLRRVAAAAALCAVAALPAPAGTLPAWSVTAKHDLFVDVGFRSADGDFDVSMEGLGGTFGLSYSLKGGFLGGGFLGTDFVKLRGTFSVAEDGVQHVALEEATRRPRFRFEGAVDETRGDFAGTYTRKDGFAGLEGEGTGPMTFARTPATAPARTWHLRLPMAMDDQGRVRGGLAEDGVTEDRARLQVFGGYEVIGGKVRGRVRTSAEDATTRAKVKVTGNDWKIRLVGPVDVDGFHAAADFDAAGFHLRGVPVLIPVVPGPEPPPPPPPKTIVVQGGRAEVVGDRVTITKSNLPDKVFGRPASIRVEFPLNDSNNTVVADPTTASGPDARIVTATLGTVAYSTATAPAAVSVTIARPSLEYFEVTCAGTVATASGARQKTFRVKIVAPVQ